MIVGLSRRHTQNHDNFGIKQIYFFWENPPRLQIMEFILPVFFFFKRRTNVFVFQNHKYVDLNLWFYSFFSSSFSQAAGKVVCFGYHRGVQLSSWEGRARSCAPLTVLEPWLHSRLPHQAAETEVSSSHDTCLPSPRAGWWKRTFWRRLLGLVIDSMN